MIVERRVDIAVPELVAETETHRKIEDDVDIGACLAARRDDGQPQLHEFAGILVEAEADAQPLAFPGAGDRQHDIGEGGGRCQVQVGVDMEFEPLQRLGAARGVGMRQQQVEAEPDQRRTLYGSASTIARYKSSDRSSPTGPAPAALGETKRLARLRRVARLDAGHVVDRHLGEMQVAAGDVDAAGQRMQDRDRPVGLRRIALLLSPVQV